MKTTRLDLPVMASWMEDNGRRLDCNPYLSGGFEARVLLNKLSAKKQKLNEVTDGIFHAGREARRYVDNPEHGVPFLGSTDILAADLSGLPFLSKKQIDKNPHFTIQEGWTLITRSGTIGRMAYVRPDMAGMACSEHVLRVIPDRSKILPGYLYAYLSSRFGVALIVSGTYGSIIQHLEPNHIADLPVPRLGDALEEEIHNLIAEAAELRTQYQIQVRQATHQLFESVGLKDITASEWHRTGADLGFSTHITTPETLRALNFNPRFYKLLNDLSQTKYCLLGDLCDRGKLQRNLRFNRVDSDSENGVKLIGQKELFWLKPEGRWIVNKFAPKDIFVENETILLAALGTLGENEVFGRCELITGSWLENAYSENIVRICPNNPEVSGAFLFAFLRSETVFRCFRSLSIGSKQQVLHGFMLSKLPVPMPSFEIRREIEDLVRGGFQVRQKASELEKRAIKIVELSIEDSNKCK